MDMCRVLSNVNRQEILRLILKERLSITDISKKVKLSYQNTFSHITYLELSGLVKRDSNTKYKFNCMYIVPIINKDNKEWFNKIVVE